MRHPEIPDEHYDFFENVVGAVVTRSLKEESGPGSLVAYLAAGETRIMSLLYERTTEFADGLAEALQSIGVEAYVLAIEAWTVVRANDAEARVVVPSEQADREEVLIFTMANKAGNAMQSYRMQRNQIGKLIGLEFDDARSGRDSNQSMHSSPFMYRMAHLLD
jgi:hypothetical protein